MHGPGAVKGGIAAGTGENDIGALLRGVGREDVERVDSFLADQAYGFAVVHLAERLTTPGLDTSLRELLEGRLQKTLDALASTGAPARTADVAISDGTITDVGDRKPFPSAYVTVGRFWVNGGTPGGVRCSARTSRLRD